MVGEKNHFQLKLNVKTEKEKSAARFRIKVLQGYTDNGGIFPNLKLANLHLIALLYYYTDDLEGAFNTISSILEIDRKNLNGHANMTFLCDRLLLSQKAKEHAKLVEALEKDADTWIQERSKVEFAYAHAFEMYREVHELLRFSESNERLEQCLERTRGKATESKHKLERAEWMMCKVWNLKKMFNRNYNTEQKTFKNEALYEEILKTLIEITNSVPEDSHLKSMAFTYFGYFFWKKPVAPSHKPDGDNTKDVKIPDVLIKHEMSTYFHDPELCFKKALEIYESVEALHQYGCWLLYVKRYDNAVQQFSRAIEIDSSESNYFAYSKRGESLMKKIEDRKTFQEKEDLDRIVKDFKLVVRVNPSSYIYRQLAMCYFYLSDKGSDPKMTSLSMSAFQEGLSCMDGKRDSHLHLSHAKCLKAIGEDKHAMFCLQRSVENQNPQSKFVPDIEMLLTWYEKLWQDQDKPLTIINEAQFWFQTAFTKYDQQKFKKMICELVKVDTTRNFYIQLFSVCWQKSNTEIKMFCCDVLKETMGPDHPLISVFQSDMIVGATSRKSLKSPDSMQTRNMKGFKYDFYVIHSDKDLEWVCYSLLNHLEHMRNFKGMLSYRDSLAGTDIFENLKTAIENSNKIIILITPNYLESNWCKYETESALINSIEDCKMGKIIPLIKDDAKIPDSLKNLKNINMDENHIKETDLENLVRALDS